MNTERPLPVSCGTLVIDRQRRLLLCHITHSRYWDLPKGMQDAGELPLETAQRELREETGLVFDTAMFEEIGEFDYRADKRLHLFRLYLRDEMDDLGHLICTSHFVHRVTGVATPEMDAFCWASRQDVPKLCGPKMSHLLLQLAW